VIRFGLTARPRPSVAAGEGGGHWRDMVTGIVEIATDPRRRALVALVWMIGCYVVPEALAVPYAAELGMDDSLVGLLMAADPLGSVLGAWLFVRFVPPDRLLSTAYLMQAQASFVRATPDESRGAAIGVVASGIVAGQGIAVLVGGLLADLWSPSTAITVCAASGMVLAAAGAMAWYRAGSERRGRPSEVLLAPRNG
jgi:MFS family permease